MILDTAETVLGYFCFDRTVYGTQKGNGIRNCKMKEQRISNQK
ncbi:MAG TPA: hypothetical protein VE076_04725 [Nitrososphaeraceae archaeon]|jgi:hypothetical protein|nr:hypothetical protein [Nitrososphaeraceae archaeon]